MSLSPVFLTALYCLCGFLILLEESLSEMLSQTMKRQGISLRNSITSIRGWPRWLWGNLTKLMNIEAGLSPLGQQGPNSRPSAPEWTTTPQGIPHRANLFSNFCKLLQFLAGSFSTVSKPIFCKTICAFQNFSRFTRFAHFCTLLHVYNRERAL